MNEQDFPSKEELLESLGIVDVQPQGRIITPIDQIPGGLFQVARPIFTSLESKELKTLDPKFLGMARLAIQAYKQARVQFNQDYRISNANHYDPYVEYGKYLQVLGEIDISPAGRVAGRYFINFTTTNLNAENDWTAWASTMCLDVQTDNLNSASPPARMDHWLFGEKEDGTLELIGQYRHLLEKHRGKLAEGLEAEGFKRFGSIWEVDTDRFVGSVSPPTQS